MRIEIDQSGKIEDYVDSVIAFRDGTQYSVLLDRRVKNRIIVKYRGEYKDVIYRLFAVCVFYCIKDYLNLVQHVVIDIEYKGGEKDIKKHLLRCIWIRDKSFDKDKISFDNIGKGSGAHRLAYQTFIGKLAPNKIITEKEVEELM